MKICLSCKMEKRLEEFYAHSEMKDGHLNRCIECVKNRVKKHRVTNIDSIRKYDRLRGRTEERLERNRIRARKISVEKRAYGIAWQQRNPDKRAAHIILGNAVRAGRINKQPCEVCKTKKVEAHHDDYTKPLEVRWLCRKHHAEIHRKYKD